MQIVPSEVSPRPNIGPSRYGRYLTFRLNGEEFGVSVLQIRELLGMQDITWIPHSPHFLRGVIELRGAPVPVVDLRLKFSFPEAEYGVSTCIIVIQTESSAGALLVGLIVDSLCEVMNVKDDWLPVTERNIPLLGTVRRNGFVKSLLDVDRLLKARELSSLERVVEAALLVN